MPFRSPDVHRDGGGLGITPFQFVSRGVYNKIFANNYFWGTWDKQEIDWVEKREGKLFGFEFKWTENKSKSLKSFSDNYNGTETKIINRDNYLEFIK